MSELYEVVAHSVTTSPSRGVRHDGVDEKAFRHWFAGAFVELDKEDAVSLLSSGAIRSSSKPEPSAPAAKK